MDNLITKLNARDDVEKENSEYFNAFVQLSEQIELSSRGNSSSMTSLNNASDLRQQNESLIHNLNQSTIMVEKLENQVRVLNSKMQNLEKVNKRFERKIEHLNMEITEKNKSIELINDELLMNQIQLNVLNEKIENLTKENTSLIQRWMEKVKMDADKLNDSNDNTS